MCPCLRLDPVPAPIPTRSRSDGDSEDDEVATAAGMVTKVVAGTDEAAAGRDEAVGTVAGMGMTAGAQCGSYMYILYSKE